LLESTREAMNDNERDPRIDAIPDIHGHAKGEHKPFAEERPIPYSGRMLFLWFFHACRRGSPRFMMVADHMNYLTFEDPAAVNLVRRALKLAAAGDLYGAAETAGVELGHAAVVSEGLRKGMHYSIGAEVDNDPRSRPDAQNIVDAMKPDGMIRSVHFLTIDHPDHGAGWQWPFDNPEFKDVFDIVGVERTWELYMATLLDAIDKLPGQIVGHFYVPAKFGHWPSDEVLSTYEDRLIEACLARGVAIEINSRYFYRIFEGDEINLQKYRAATLRLLKKAKAKGVQVAVGSDAHSPKDQGNGFDEVLRLLDAAGINEIAFPINGRLARVALKATEELLKQRAVPPPPPVGSSVTGFGRAELAAASRNGGVSQTEEVEEHVQREKRTASAVKTAVKSAAAKRAAAGPKPAAALKSAGKAVAPKDGVAKAAAAKAAPKAAAAKIVPAKAASAGAKSPAAKVVAAKPAAKPAPKTAAKPAPKTAAKPAAKVAAKKAVPPKKAVPARKAVPAKPAARSASAKKVATKKAPPSAAVKKKTPLKAKASVKKSAPLRRPAAKKSSAKRAPAAKKSAVKKGPAKKAKRR
jgi:HisJ family histidinol phosphate phosphatase